MIDGAECEHLAFRTFDTDWQLRVRAGDQPIPCKMVVTSKTIAGAPQYTLRIKSWEGVETVDPGLFRFDPPAGSKELTPDSLITFDELPPQSEN
ncbi:MAG: DUF2092 domain-containing protein [Desulfofustis sp.]|nr:DUF2092 domain-containing protein [Desulfofustis sp.]